MPTSRTPLWTSGAEWGDSMGFRQAVGQTGCDSGGGERGAKGRARPMFNSDPRVSPHQPTTPDLLPNLLHIRPLQVSHRINQFPTPLPIPIDPSNHVDRLLDLATHVGFALDHLDAQADRRKDRALHLDELLERANEGRGDGSIERVRAASLGRPPHQNIGEKGRRVQSRGQGKSREEVFGRSGELCDRAVIFVSWRSGLPTYETPAASSHTEKSMPQAGQRKDFINVTRSGHSGSITHFGASIVSERAINNLVLALARARQLAGFPGEEPGVGSILILQSQPTRATATPPPGPPRILTFWTSSDEMLTP
ncbi:hypothetical protein BDK51DRAFT_46815 [Blyttiomyces helicus]|uniref:Uncharacterized protein n=1 Tax=Blyttiomyces helicus TaxID=388810 RepID=A0A4P9WJQ4_9FUNG|nr:hypothetical protein BDK51DRAFT_46815 [Blyttiomyces helicus]|eukprot:RKO93179.1 hypothetical protein BDK51DRAFT_46815 [Blyttiomyces helicus]